MSMAMPEDRLCVVATGRRGIDVFDGLATVMRYVITQFGCREFLRGKHRTY